MKRVLSAIAAVVLGVGIVVAAPLAAVAAPPVITGLNPTTLTHDTTPVSPFPAVVVADDDSPMIDVLVTWDPTKGTLAGDGFTTAPGTLTATGVDPAAVTTSLQGLVFTPIVGQTADVLITIAAVDDAGTITASTTVSVTAITPIEVHIGATGTGVYGATATVTPTYPDGEAGIVSPPTCVSSTLVTDPVGTYPGAASCSGATADSGYTIVYVPGDVAITPATLTVTASDGTAAYGGALPIIGASYTGFVNGNTEADVTDTTCAVATPVTVPTTTTSCTGAVSAN